MLGASDEEAKERCMEAYREEKRNVEKCIYQSKKIVNEQFGGKMNKDVNGNRKLFWKEVSNAKGGWHKGRTNCEISGRSILKICIIYSRTGCSPHVWL